MYPKKHSKSQYDENAIYTHNAYIFKSFRDTIST